MTTTINASLSAGLVQTADTSGNLSLQSGGTTILALTSAGAAVTGTLSATGTTTLGASTERVQINRLSDGTAYGLVSLNGLDASTTASGIYGRGSGGDSGKLFITGIGTVVSQIAGVTVTSVSSTGLAVTGTLSATGLTLDSSGNLGIGVTPAAGEAGYKGVQIGNAALYGRTGNTTNSEMYLAANSTIDEKYIGNDYAAILYSNDGAWFFKTAASGTAGNAISWTTAMTIGAAGTAVTGTLSSTSDLTIGTGNGTSTAGMTTLGDGVVWRYARSSNPAIQVTRLTDDGNLVEFYKSDGTLRGSISISGTTTAYNTTSDATLKNKIGPAPVSVSKQIIMESPISEYTWKADPSEKHHIGPLAQELYDSGFHGAVNVGGIRTDELGNEKYEPWAVDKTAFQYHLVVLAQDHETKIDALEARLAALEAK